MSVSFFIIKRATPPITFRFHAVLATLFTLYWLGDHSGARNPKPSETKAHALGKMMPGGKWKNARSCLIK